MQRVILHKPSETTPVNKWFLAKHSYQMKKLYSLFFKTHHQLRDQAPDDLYHFDHQNILLSSEGPGQLQELLELTDLLFKTQGPEAGYGQHLRWATHALYHETLKLKENRAMILFHEQEHQQDDASQQAFIQTIQQETQTQFKSIGLLLDNACNLLRLMLQSQDNNDLLIRLLIEQEPTTQMIWNQSTDELLADMFPYQPEAGYALAGKSYFMGQWLSQALQAYEKSLELNPALSESRRQTYLIRAMIKDRDLK